MAKTKKSPSKSLTRSTGHGAGHPRIRTDKLDEFLILLNNNFSQRAAARIARVQHGSVYKLLTQEWVIKRREELRQQALQALPVAPRALQAFAEIDHARGELCEMAVHGEGKKSGRLRACNVLLQSHGLIDAPGPKAFSQAGAVAGVPGQTTYEVFKASWKQRQEHDMEQRIIGELNAVPPQQ